MSDRAETPDEIPQGEPTLVPPTSPDADEAETSEETTSADASSDDADKESAESGAIVRPNAHVGPMEGAIRSAYRRGEALAIICDLAPNQIWLTPEHRMALEMPDSTYFGRLAFFAPDALTPWTTIAFCIGTQEDIFAVLEQRVIPPIYPVEQDFPFTVQEWDDLTEAESGVQLVEIEALDEDGDRMEEDAVALAVATGARVQRLINVAVASDEGLTAQDLRVALQRVVDNELAAQMPEAVGYDVAWDVEMPAGFSETQFEHFRLRKLVSISKSREDMLRRHAIADRYEIEHVSPLMAAAEATRTLTLRDEEDDEAEQDARWDKALTSPWDERNPMRARGSRPDVDMHDDATIAAFWGSAQELRDYRDHLLEDHAVDYQLNAAFSIKAAVAWIDMALGLWASGAVDVALERLAKEGIEPEPDDDDDALI